VAGRLWKGLELAENTNILQFKPMDIDVSIEEIQEAAVQFALAGHSLKCICSLLRASYKGTVEELEEIILTTIDKEVDFYKKIYRSQEVIRLNTWLTQLNEDLGNSSVKLHPSLIQAGLKVLERRTQLLNEMTGHQHQKSALSINYTIEGINVEDL